MSAKALPTTSSPTAIMANMRARLCAFRAAASTSGDQELATVFTALHTWHFVWRSE